MKKILGFEQAYKMRKILRLLKVYNLCDKLFPAKKAILEKLMGKLIFCLKSFQGHLDAFIETGGKNYNEVSKSLKNMQISFNKMII